MPKVTRAAEPEPIAPESAPAGVSRLELDSLSVRLPGQPYPLVEDASLVLGPGHVVALCGSSGAGKSSLLHAVAGLLPWSRPAAVTGRVLIDGEDVSDLDPGQRAHGLATCLDRPEAQLFLGTPRQELEAAARLHGDRRRFDEVAERLGIVPLLERRVTDLSSGERQRVALAVALLGAPRPVLLDEPTANLDGYGAEALDTALHDAAAAGGAVLVAEQAPWRLGAAISSCAELRGGEIRAAALPARPELPSSDPPGDEVVLEARGLTISRTGRPLLEGIDLRIRAGEIVVMTGRNGCGKSSLARALAGHAATAGVRTRGRLRATRRIGLMIASSELQLFAETVARELSLTGLPLERTASALRSTGLDHLAARAPWTLSRGERQRLVHLLLDLVDPGLVILDEPAQGLDPASLLALAETIVARAAAGRAYLIVTHREELERIAHRVLRVEDGTLVEAQVSA